LSGEKRDFHAKNALAGRMNAIFSGKTRFPSEERDFQAKNVIFGEKTRPHDG
jgi:hypothetical protein